MSHMSQYPDEGRERERGDGKEGGGGGGGGGTCPQCSRLLYLRHLVDVLLFVCLFVCLFFPSLIII